MKRWMLLVGLLIIALVLIAVGFFFFLNKAPATPGQTTENPFGSLTTGTQTQTTPHTTIVLTSGASVSVPDFTKENQPAWAGPSGYLVAGTNSSDFLITYIPSDGGSASQFTIVLYAEPIGATRKAAEAALRNRLQLTDAELCELDVVVATGPGVNATYDGVNLGISSCSGSVPLPT